MATLIQLIGVAAIIVGAVLISPAVGFIVGGVLVTIMGIAMEPTVKKKRGDV